LVEPTTSLLGSKNKTLCGEHDAGTVLFPKHRSKERLFEYVKVAIVRNW
jgi:hypothetical protein